MINLSNSVRDSIEMLNTYRNRYNSNEYSQKIYANIVYNLLPFKLLWNEIEKCFGRKNYNNIDDAYLAFGNLYREHQIMEIKPNIEIYLRDTHQIGSYDLYPLTINTKKASEGDNKKIEEIEYTYVFAVAVKEYLLYWIGLGLLGYTPNTALQTLTGITSFNKITKLSDAMGPITIICSQDVEKLYKPLPNYW